MRPSPVTQKNLWRIVKLEWKKDYDLEVTESGSPSPWWMSWFTTRHTTKSRWLSIYTDPQLSCLSRSSLRQWAQGECNLPFRNLRGQLPALQELVDKSFQIKKSSQTSSWH